MPEYKRQWVVELKRKGLYKEPDKDSMRLENINDSLRFIKNEGIRAKLLLKRDSLQRRLTSKTIRK